jgi:hypothetical protein
MALRASINGTQLSAHGSLPVEQLQNITLHWKSEPGKLATVIFYDLDAPYPNHAVNSPYLHMLVINAPNGNLQAGQALIEYAPPSPPQDSAMHRYVFAVYEQAGPIHPELISQRERFNLNQFVLNNQLRLLGELEVQAYWYQGRIWFRLSGERGGYGSPPAALSTLSQTFLPSTTSPNVSSPSPPGSPRPSFASTFIPTSSLMLTPMLLPSPGVSTRANLFLPGNTLSEQEQKYCHCVLEVAAKQPGACSAERAWFEQRDGRTCSNPYAVCAKTTGTSYRHCGANYNYEALPDREIEAYANLSHIPVPEPYNRAQMITNIYQWKESKGK